MIEFIYQDRQFTFVPTKGKLNFSKMKWIYPYKSPLAKVIEPIVKYTCFKWTPLPSIYETGDKEYIQRETELMNKLKDMNKIPVIECTYNNAFYINDLDQIIDRLSKKYDRNELIDYYCKQFGVSKDVFLKNLGPDMVFLGRKYANSAVLAHEFGHYQCTRNFAGKLGKIVHDNYGPHGKLSDRLSDVGNVLEITTFITSSLTQYLTIIPIGELITLIASAGSIHYGKTIIKAESEATRMALKSLSSIGCTKDELTVYSGSLKGALNTYKQHYLISELKSVGRRTFMGALAGALMYIAS